MAKQESFRKIENETFYTSPPYNYRPAIAEYLTSFYVSKNSFIAEVMHLDHKKNLKIIEFNKDYLLIKLIDSKDLDSDELVVYSYLESLKQNSEIKLFIERIPKKILKKFWILAMYKTYNKLGVKYYDGFNKQEYRQTYNENTNYAGIGLSRIIIGLFFTFLNFYGILSLILLILGIKKISREKQEIKYFFKRFIFRYILISISYFIILIIPLSLLTAPGSNFQKFLIYLPILIIAYVILWAFFFYQFSKVLYDYIVWVFESDESSEHRRNWLSFKKFVIDHSELEKAPLSHYKLWGPFYYYTLAVGGIKNPKIKL